MRSLLGRTRSLMDMVEKNQQPNWEMDFPVQGKQFGHGQDAKDAIKKKVTAIMNAKGEFVMFNDGESKYLPKQINIARSKAVAAFARGSLRVRQVVE